jgi:UDP-glucose 4-epimerase
LNYETKTTLQQSIQETVDYIKAKGPKPFDYAYPLEIITDKTPKTWSERLM